MAVRHYAREHMIRIKASERSCDSNEDSDNSESEDHYPLIRPISKGVPFNVDVYEASKRRDKLIPSSVSMAMVMPMSAEVGTVYSYMPN
ncbi:hypothetical protein KPH14_005835 [Odynerus spinipes]|uniref:Uncharacterized protein n=1 Tax=Odynerus spinipes TaxID=1348599 RepID=A0AAD9VJZ5_9HYME|nr:hypothetical protein KPH14_005835 [Odynerus spinipes]